MWERSLFYYLSRLGPSESDVWDILKETWLKVYRSIGTLRDPRTLPAFLYTTARHAAISRWRVRSTEEFHVNHDPVANEDNPAIAFDNAEQVHHALDQLPMPQREVLTLYFLEELSIDDIAHVLEIPAGTVKSRLYYAKCAMRKILINGDDHAEQSK